MAKILEFIRSDYSFDPEAVAILSKAYDMALASLRDQPEAVREVIARRIIEAARRGERNPDKLCAVALTAFDTYRRFR
jgi:hypothetical protein